MANGQPKPRIDYAAFIKSEIQAGWKFGQPWKQEVLRRTYRMMKTDPYYQDGETFDYNQMQTDAIAGLDPNDRAGKADAVIEVIHLTEKDPVWLKRQEQEEEAADIAELEQEDASELQKLEQQMRPAPTSRQPTKAQLQSLAEEQGNWITLKSGRKVFIKKK